MIVFAVDLGVIAQQNTSSLQNTTTSKATCLTQSINSTGSVSGTAKSDLPWLQTFEDTSFYYRMTGVQLCSVNKVLKGVRALVTKIVTKDNKIGTEEALSRFGNVNQTTSVSCQVLKLDQGKGEYISSM